MKSSVKRLKNCRHIVDVTVPAEKVRQELDNAYESIGKFANVPGFRPGKVPRDLLELHYSKTAKEEVIKRLIPETYEDVLKEHSLDPIGYPDISEVKLDKDGFSYKADIETRPEIRLKDYKGLRLKKRAIEVKEEDVTKQLEYLQNMYAQNAPAKDGKEGEKEKVIPKLDDEFAKDIGFENLDKLKDAVRQDIKAKSEADAKADLEMQVIDQLVEKMDFEVPETLVKDEKDRLLKETEARMKYLQELYNQKTADKKFELTDNDKKQLEENALKQANRQVMAFFILDKIAITEKIYLTKEEIDIYIDDMAKQYKKTKEEMRGYLEAEHMLDEIAVNMRNRKVMEFLLKEAVLV